MIKTIEWTKDGVRMLDQRLLPTEEKYLMLRSYEEVADAIRKMAVRGAPAIGVSAAMGVALGASQSVGTSIADLEDDFNYICEVMSQTRPTAVNLFWAIERMRTALNREKVLTDDVEVLKKKLVSEALAIFQEDIASNRAIGKHGAPLIPDGATVLTHCNAGALATAGDYGTALGVIARTPAYCMGTGSGQHSCNGDHRQYGRACHEGREGGCSGCRCRPHCSKW